MTPATSPSVILSNPSYLPVPLLPGVGSSQAQACGSWDNFVEDPTYQAQDQEFWDSRSDPRKIQLVSTDISELEDDTLLSDSGASTDPDQSRLETTEMAPSAERVSAEETL